MVRKKKQPIVEEAPAQELPSTVSMSAIELAVAAMDTDYAPAWIAAVDTDSDSDDSNSEAESFDMGPSSSGWVSRETTSVTGLCVVTTWEKFDDVG